MFVEGYGDFYIQKTVRDHPCQIANILASLRRLRAQWNAIDRTSCHRLANVIPLLDVLHILFGQRAANEQLHPPSAFYQSIKPPRRHRQHIT
ncbi:MAG TPA: hypothetical protein VGG19_07400 [Tepidisphaeraceae bacterium]